MRRIYRNIPKNSNQKENGQMTHTLSTNQIAELFDQKNLKKELSQQFGFRKQEPDVIRLLECFPKLQK